MKYIVAILLLIPFFHLISFGKYNLKNNNKTAAIGAFLLAAVSTIFPLVVLFLK